MKITVKRYDPSKDAAPYDVAYDVPHSGDDYMTALEALVYIHENIEPLAFDYACRGRMCGRCSMTVDGKPCLACVHVIDDSDHAIEPLAGLPVVKDLIVDKSKIQEEISKSYHRVRYQPCDLEDIQTYNMEDAEDIAAIQYCARCQVCTAGCPARMMLGSEYIGPSHMLAIALRHFDPYDQADRIVEAVQGGLWSCTMCGTCTSLCSQIEIDHVAIWQKLRDEATARGLIVKK